MVFRVTVPSFMQISCQELWFFYQKIEKVLLENRFLGGQQPQLQFDNVITVIFHVTISNNIVLSRTA